VLGRVARQMRIVDLWIASAEPREWQHAVATAALTAVRDPQVAEVTAAASIPITRQAFENSGFRNRGAVPIFIYDPKNLLPPAPLNLTLIDGDAAWWYDPAYPFLT